MSIIFISYMLDRKLLNKEKIVNTPKMKLISILKYIFRAFEGPSIDLS